MPAGSPKIRVLIVDDSAIVRKLLSEALAPEPDIEVVGTAPDPYIARDKIVALDPDVLTLDIEMPRMDGLTFLEKLSRFHPLPVIIISSLAQSSCDAALEAMRRGAVHVIAKPGGPYSVGDLKIDLPHAVRAAAAARRRPVLDVPPPPYRTEKGTTQIARASSPPGSVIAIGASTGGTEAIQRVLLELPADVPPVLITQHIPPRFSASFAKRLNQICAFEVKEAVDGDILRPGLALLAPGDFHLLVRNAGGRLRAVVKEGPRVMYQRPSVDVLFESVAAAAGPSATGIILTGMGKDGANGLLKMRRSGAHTIAQDEASCVVFGMPREAIELGAAEEILPLSAIGKRALELALSVRV
jgi:two-component system chemotaxis response regulator CheB